MNPTLPDETVLKVLLEGELSLRGEFMWGSNYTYLADSTLDTIELKVVYKPTRGVRPLWDFPAATLARREAAAYVLSQALGWGLVPPTVYRKQGPLGPGSLQLYIEHDPEYHYFNFSPEDRQRLRPVALFDMLANNADRKGSHILVDPQQAFKLIDHGLCFHEENKLRTVIWDFAGENLPDELCASLANLQHQLSSSAGVPAPLRQQLQAFISPAEIGALLQRTTRLLQQASFPNPDPSRRPYPWPPV